MPQFERVAFNPATAPRPLGAYSHAVKVTAGSMLYVAGQVGVDANGNLVGPGDVAAQTRQVLHNIGCVLTGAGASFANVVEFTTYLVGRESIQPFIDARTQVFPGLYPSGDYPPNTLLIISGLVLEEFLVEISAVAALP